MSNDRVDGLDFDEKFQEAVVGHMFSDYTFFLQCEGQIDYRSFHSPYHQEIVRTMYEMFRRGEGGLARQHPSVEEVRTNLFQKYHEIESQRPYGGAFDLIQLSKKAYPLGTVQRYMTGWIKSLRLRDMYQNSIKLFNDRKYEEAAVYVDRTMADVKSASFHPEDKVRFINLIDFYKRRAVELNDHCCTIGHWEFDELIRKGSKLNFQTQANDTPWKILRKSTAGSLAPGGTTVILGATNSGKTTFLISIIVANLIMGKRVLLITHEQLEGDIKAKIIESILGMSDREIQIMVEVDPERAKRELGRAERICETYLTYIPWIRTGAMYVEKVVSIIQHQQELLKAKLSSDYRKELEANYRTDTSGGRVTLSKEDRARRERAIVENRGFDLVVDDYPKKLRALEFKNRAISEHDEVQYVYAQFVNLARERGNQFHCITPAQGNREAFKVSTRGDSDRMLDLGDGAASYGLMHEVDNVISINRKQTDIASCQAKFYLTKCRLNATGSTFVSKTRMEQSRMIGPELQCQPYGPGQQVSEASVSAQWATIKRDADVEEALKKNETPALDPNKPAFDTPNPAADPEGAEPAFGWNPDGSKILDPTEIN